MIEVAADDIDSGLRAGSLEVRLARTAAEVDASQALRYRVFYEEMDAVPDADRARRRRRGLVPNPIFLASALRWAAYFGATIG